MKRREIRDFIGRPILFVCWLYSSGMSFDRLIYDDRTYRENLKQSTSPLNYVMNPIRYRNCHKCRAEFGIVGGQDASLVEKNMVDVESDLQGRTRLLTNSSCGKYQPKCNGKGKCTSDNGIPYDCDECKPPQRHLRSCSMVQYKPRPTDVGYVLRQPDCSEERKAVKRRWPSIQADAIRKMKDQVRVYNAKHWQDNTGTIYA